MRILFVCHRLPYPPKRGGKIRPFNIIRHLARSHEVVVASLARSRREIEEGTDLSRYAREVLVERVTAPASWLRMLARLPSGVPSSMGYFFSPRLARRIRRALDTTPFDLIFVHCSSMAQYVLDVGTAPRILDFGDMDSQKWLAYGRIKPFPLSLGYDLEGLKMQLAEAELARRFDLSTCTTRAELATLEGLGTGARTGWFPNGVDAELFRPGLAAYDPSMICFVGRMDYFPNQECMFDFCATTLPLVRARRPDVRLVIVGASPSARVRRLANLPGVEVTGSVPEVQPFVQRAALTVAPLNIARGTQNKILEAMAMGVPTVCSPPAAAGVDAVPGEHLLVGRTPREYAEAILKLIEDPTERRRLAEAGRTRALTHHSWTASMDRLDGIIASCLATSAVPAEMTGRSR